MSRLMLRRGDARRLTAPLLALTVVVVSLTVGAAEARPRSHFAKVYRDDFDGGKLHRRWSAYTGSSSADPWSRWTASRVRVVRGALELSGRPDPSHPGRWLTGGVSNWRTARTYGRWTIRFRATPSSVLSYHFLLWPKSERWPPEIDIVESWSPTRRAVSGYVHYLGADGRRASRDKTVKADFTKAHTVSLTWTPRALVYRLDGRVWWRVTGRAVPHEPMWLALQTESQICDRSRSACTGDSRRRTPKVLVDWVKVESYRP